MQIVDLLATFSNPETFDSLTTTQRLMAGLVTTLLGMGITFVALVTLMVVTSFMDKLGGKRSGEKSKLRQSLHARQRRQQPVARRP
jgi:Na+-transporting methylmalonyl-CoA/oxaloacetate decarboxylase gamma subunit